MMPLVVNGSNIYYYGFIYKGTALQAEAFCRNHNMDLLSIETPEEHAFLEESLLNYCKYALKYTLNSSSSCELFVFVIQQYYLYSLLVPRCHRSRGFHKLEIVTRK
nr:unnamed protein product [Callosobruchus analis]